MDIFHDGDLQSGISRAIQEQKLVACFVRAEDDVSSTWESSFLTSMRDDLAAKTVLLRIDADSQEASFLNAFCPVDTVPTLAIINNGQVMEKLEGGISEDDFRTRLTKAIGTTDTTANQLSQDESQAHTQTEDATTAQPEPRQSEQQSTPSQPQHETQGVQGLFPGRAERLEIQNQERQATEKAERAARAKARRKEAEDAQATGQEKGKQRATDETSSKEKARKDWLVQQKQRKDEAKQERQRILAQIENDKQERKARAQQQKADELHGPSEPLRDLSHAASQRRAGPASMCSLQIRLFDGSSIRGRFEATSTLASRVRPWIKQTGAEDAVDVPYTFRQILAPQPSRTIEVSEEHQTLLDLGLVPSATLVLTPVADYANAYASAGGGIVGSAINAAYWVFGIASNFLSSALSYVPGFANPAPSETAADPVASESTSGPSRSQSLDAGNAKFKMKTLADQRAEAASDKDKQAEFYNGNSSAFEGRKDEDENA